MGATVSEIVQDGLLQAGNTSLTARAKRHLLRWLQTQAKNFLWADLKAEDSVDLATGAESVSIGAGSGGVSVKIDRINDPLQIFEVDGDRVLNMNVVRIVDSWGEVIDAPNDGRGPGRPTKARVAATSTKGEWELSFDYEADKDYTLEFSYYKIPDDPGDAEEPWYPNDETMVQVVLAFGLRANKEYKAAAEADQILKGMISQDKLGGVTRPGINDSGPKLDPKVFR